MFHDDLCFDGEEGRVGTDPGADRTAKIAASWNELARQRHAREVMVNDLRTTRLVQLLNVANKLTALSHDLTNLTLHDDNVSLKLLQHRLAKAERLAEDIYEHELEAANG